MFVLELYDRKGNQLNEGDIVKISNGRETQFFAEVKYLESEGIITPFHTFSFTSFEKVDKLPDNAEKADEKRYSIWYIPRAEDPEGEDFRQYLMSWRECEHHLTTFCWKIKKTLF